MSIETLVNLFLMKTFRFYRKIFGVSIFCVGILYDSLIYVWQQANKHNEPFKLFDNLAF